MKKPLGPNYWKLWSASAVSNLGDGVAVIISWLASDHRDGFKLGLVVLAGRLRGCSSACPPACSPVGSTGDASSW